jgi:hypothetical protein
VRRLISRTAVLGLSVLLALGAAVVPSAAGDTAAYKTGGKLTRLSPASKKVLAAGSTRKQTSSTPGPFFKSARGKVTLVLMGAGTALTLWSIQHDRKPVKSPVR